MICTRCGHTNPDGSLTCEACGIYLGKYGNAAPSQGGAVSIRQGKAESSSAVLDNTGRSSSHRSEYGDYGLSSAPSEHASSKDRSRGPVDSKGRYEKQSRYQTLEDNPFRRKAFAARREPHRPGTKRLRLNWMVILVIVFVLGAGAFVGYKLYMSKSENGQISTARKNVLLLSAKTQEEIEDTFTMVADEKDSLRQEEREELLEEWNKSDALYYWQNGQDYLAEGDVSLGILSYRIANVLDPDNYDMLLLLGNAYELNLQDDLAEAVYTELITNLSPSRTEAYSALISLLLEQERNPEAADMMKLAYNQTGKVTFSQQRSEFIPNTPVSSLSAGRYQIDKLEGKIYLTSPQGYDIYYTMDDNAVLPQDGLLMQDGFQPVEGSVKLRAVCVSDDLCSDEFTASYTFYYRQPPAPRSSLASGTYSKRYSVTLKAGVLSDEDKLKKAEIKEIESHYRYYYTIDGSIPTTNSPEFTGDPIQMPSGRVTLRAICVNEYDKSSSTLEVGYKFTVKPYMEEMYSETDTFGKFTLNKTLYDDFISEFGSPKEQIDTVYISSKNTARHLVYDWGYAVFMLEKSAWKLVRLETARNISTGPRGANIGDTEAEVVALFKDYGQLPNQDESRGLYYDYPSVGKVLISEEGQRYIEYTCQTSESRMWVLQFWLTNGKVSKITHYYKP